MTIETVKKTKAPARSKTAVKAKAAESEGAVKAVAAMKTGKTAAKAANVSAASAPSYGEIAQLAERYWTERGWQDGYAEQDWLRAEQTLSGAAS
jgi:hypothetical protein